MCCLFYIKPFRIIPLVKSPHAWQVHMMHPYFLEISKMSKMLNIWYQHRKYIKMSTSKPIFNPVVLEITGDIYKNKSLKHVVSVKSVIIQVEL